MRPADRIPLILGALERRWREHPADTFMETLDRTTEDTGWERHPLFALSDEALLQALGTDDDDQVEHDHITALLHALETRWRRFPDQRLGQLLVNAYRAHHPYEPHRLFAIPDGRLLSYLEPLTAQEQRYVDEEPAAQNRGLRDALERSQNAQPNNQGQAGSD